MSKSTVCSTNFDVCKVERSFQGEVLQACPLWGEAWGKMLETGPPYTIRTCDRSLRRRVLYPTELRAGCGETRGNCTSAIGTDQPLNAANRPPRCKKISQKHLTPFNGNSIIKIYMPFQ